MWLAYLFLTCASFWCIFSGFTFLSIGEPGKPDVFGIICIVLGIIFAIAIIYIYIKDKVDDIKYTHNLEQELDAYHNICEQFEDALQKSDNDDNQINIDTRKNDGDKEHTLCEVLHGVKFYDKRIK